MRISIIAALGLAAAMSTGCMMTVEQYEMTDWRSEGYDIAIVHKTERDPLMLMESYNDDYSIWAVNSDPQDMCLAYGTFGQMAMASRLSVPSGQSVRIMRSNGKEYTYRIWSALSDPGCSKPLTN